MQVRWEVQVVHAPEHGFVRGFAADHLADHLLPWTTLASRLPDHFVTAPRIYR
jgi:hypothetical protein